jgi:hypothetical protein
MWLYVVSIPTLGRTMILEYLAKDVANGIIFFGIAYSNGPPF